jgi:hypothetical protein
VATYTHRCLIVVDRQDGRVSPSKVGYFMKNIDGTNDVEKKGCQGLFVVSPSSIEGKGDPHSFHLWCILCNICLVGQIVNLLALDLASVLLRRFVKWSHIWRHHDDAVLCCDVI